ncbi:WecB/TagA/CpsF family glycosyltransferase [Haloferula sp.]|uniref:WecB/TagA/CpsF family glycosyltransferase n=1 Tax=Haloferula sp. TaxID=2497595 RepID=UPI003C77C2F4
MTKTVDMESVTVLNTPCILTDSARLTAALEDHCSGCEREAISVDFTNVHIVAMRTEDEEFYATTSNVDWFVSDSQVLTWAISWLGGKNHARVYGPAFLDYFVKHADEKLTHYFLGGSQECLEKLLEKLRYLKPELRIVGSQNGYFGSMDEAEILSGINSKSPDILWVGLGTPKQQQWISRMKSELRVGAALAVGFAFDVNAGTKKDAPRWLGKMGLTWLYRFACEPRRLWHRYAHYNTLFVRLLLLQLRR